MNRQPEPQRDALAAVLIVIAAHATSQAALIVLKAAGKIGWHWAAVLTPTWIIAAVFLAIIIAGTVMGIRDEIRHKRKAQEIEERLKQDAENIIRQLFDGEEDE